MALADTPPLQDEGPAQVTLHRLPPQANPPEQLRLALQSIVTVVAFPSTPPEHERLPVHRT